jgi:hypothetical protein
MKRIRTPSSCSSASREDALGEHLHERGDLLDRRAQFSVENE